MTELDIVAGRIICAGTFSYSGEQLLTYTPQLTAAVTNPNLDTGTSEGWWLKFGNLVLCWGVIEFAGAGADPGSGAYEISLPTQVTELAPLNYVGSGPLLGWGVARDNSAVAANSRQLTPRLLDTVKATTGLGAFRLSITDGTSTVVTDSAPFTWFAGDRISFHCIYPAPLEMLT